MSAIGILLNISRYDESDKELKFKSLLIYWEGGKLGKGSMKY